MPKTLSDEMDQQPNRGSGDTRFLASPFSSSATLPCESSAAEKTASEPQNPLTRQFTEAEWEALRKFRPRLHDVYVAAYGPNEEGPEVFSIWGIQVDVADPMSDPRVSVVLMKFLRAKSLDVNGAHEMLVNTLKWRKSVNIDILVAEPVEGRSRLFGRDKKGIPVQYIQMSQIDWGKFGADRYLALQNQIRAMEQNARFLNFEDVCQVVKVVDCSDLKWQAVPVDLGPQLQSIHNHYPNFIAYRIGINFPHQAVFRWFHGLINFFSGMLGIPPSASNFVGTNVKTIARTLLSNIDADNLPRQFGGEADGFSWPKDVQQVKR